ncbi:hypothetical protein ACXIUS_22105 [Bosea thiooxidans]|nr:hypothetical protein [Bosea sp. (in: a-proteobacteria)]
MSAANTEADTAGLDQLQNVYEATIEEWIVAIREEGALASVNHSVNDIDNWEAAHFKEDELRNKVLEAEKLYEDAPRQKFFGF